MSETNNGERQTSRNMAMLWDMAKFVSPYKKTIAGALVALLFAASATLMIGQAVRLLLDKGFSENSANLNLYFIGLMGVIVILALATFGRYYLVSWLGERVVSDIRKAVYNHVIGLSPTFYESTRTGEILSRLTTDTTLIQTVVGSSASIALRNFLLFVGGLGLLIYTSPKLAAMVLVVVPLIVLPIIFFGRKVRQLSRINQDAIADISAVADETLSAVQTSQAYNHEQLDRERFGYSVETGFRIAMARVSARAWLTGLVILLVFGAVDFVLWSGAKDVVGGQMTPGTLGSFVFYAVIVAGSMGSLSEVWGELQRAAGASERLMELLAEEPVIAAPSDILAPPGKLKHGIAFDDVTFNYPSRPDMSALQNLSLHIAPGEKVALVGPSGAGKTTIFQMLLRFYDPGSGQVTFDGISLKDMDPEAVRRHLGLVPQDPVVFAGTAYENISYGRPGASMDEVYKAAEAAAAKDFIDRLPEGFDSAFGEKGFKLSGGQKQRIAIARAILRDPDILLLDEATSALDAESERLIQDALDRLMKGRTTLIIAHRLATVLKADRIVVLDEGRVVAQGTHKQLMEEGGLYSRLARLQFDIGAEALSA